MELLIVGSILSLIMSVTAIILAVYGIIIIKSMERSTHTVTWQTASPKELEETAAINEKWNKEMHEDSTLEELGF